MTVRKLKVVAPRLEALVAQDQDLLKALAKEALDQVPEGADQESRLNPQAMIAYLHNLTDTTALHRSMQEERGTIPMRYRE